MSYYLFPFEKILENSRIVLYGAGNVGNQFYDQITGTNFCEIVLWLDKNADEVLVKSPKTISHLNVDDYDFVIIAIENKATMLEVKTLLINYGVPKDKILHKIYFCSKPCRQMNFHTKQSYPIELTHNEKRIIDYIVDNFLSMVSRERLFATLMSCKYAIMNNIDGDFVECGVWKGGNSIIAAWMFKLYNSHKKVYLYDTFNGMTSSTEVDIDFRTGLTAQETFDSIKLDKNRLMSTHINKWAYASIDDVKNNFSKLGLLSENVIFVQGDVLQTLEQSNIPEKIAVLRLDTDWYESTKREMEILYPRISTSGVLMIDDYGCWGGSKKAVDEFFEKDGYRPFLQYIDYTGRLGIKTTF